MGTQFSFHSAVAKVFHVLQSRGDQRVKNSNLCLMVLPFAFWGLSSKQALGAGGESSAGAIVSLYSPNYSAFKTIVTEKGEPDFPAQVLMTGGHATFARKGFITGGRVAFGQGKTSLATSGSYFSVGHLGFVAGYGVDFGAFDFMLGSLMGIGTTSFSSGSPTKGSIVEANYLLFEPQGLIGFTLASSFKVSVGGTYAIGLVHRLNQFGSELITDPKKVKIGGTSILIQLSFGAYN